MPVAPSEGFLMKKAGPLPVWAWGGLGLGAAYAYSKHKAGKANQAQQQQPAAPSAAQPASGGPEYVIENNLPWQQPASSPVNVTVTGPTPVVTPPGTSPSPPVVTPKPPVPAPKPPVPAPTPAPPRDSPPPPPAPAPAPQPIPYKVVSGDSLWKIAETHGYGSNWQAIWNFNVGPTSPHSAAGKATLQKQGPNLIYPGQIIYIPPK